MCYLHGCRPAVLHRDLKSPNLLVDRHWRVKVGDFGLSRVTLSSVAIASVAGVHSPRWMAPEVLVDGAHSKASDVFSFAEVLWELATLAVPWEAANQWQVMHAVADEKARCPLPTAVTPPFPMLAGYLDLMGSAWAHEPRERPTFGALVQELQRLLDALVAAERPPAERSVRGGAEAPKAVVEAPVPPAPAPAPVPEPPAAEPEPAQPPPAEPPAAAPEAFAPAAPERAPTPPPEASQPNEAPAAEESSASVAPSLAPEASEGGTLLSPAAPAPPTGAAAKAIAARKAAKARKAAAGAAS
jgi:serine/threonine protein kinase